MESSVSDCICVDSLPPSKASNMSPAVFFCHADDTRWRTLLSALVVGMAVMTAPVVRAQAMSGMGMMKGSGVADRPACPGWGGGLLSYGQVEAYIRRGMRQGTIDARSHTVLFSGTNVTIDLIAMQPGHPDQTFEVAGLTNPTLVVSRGAVVRLSLVNMDYGDTMEHGLILTQVPPPYPYRLRKDKGPILAQIMPLLPWRSEKAVVQARYATLSTTFVARQPGTYWYVCPTPGHAEQGMYGRFIVR